MTSLADRSRGRFPIASATACIVLALGFAAFSHRHAADARHAAVNLVVITLDTTRADRLGAYGSREGLTPNLDWLASTGALFEQATTAAPLTLPSHCSLFTGRFPPGHGVRENAGFALGRGPVVLADALRARGYRTGAFVASYILRRDTGLARGFDVYEDAFASDARPGGPRLRLPADLVTDEALAWLDGGSSPFFAWVHFYDAHGPCAPPERYRTARPGRPYDGAIAFMDAQVGRLVGGLRRRGVLERTVVVVIADHGESLGEHGEFTHARRLYEGVLHVPFIVRAPVAGFGGRRVQAVVRSVDLLPTVLALLGVPAPPGIDGVSLLPLVRGDGGDANLEAYAETLYPWLRRGGPPGYALRRGPFKLIEQGDTRLFDVATDPGETRDLSAERPDVAASLSVRLAGLHRVHEDRSASVPGADERSRLDALGYVSGAGGGVRR